MLTIGLSSYIARVRRKREKNLYLPLDKFDGATDFFDFLTSVLRGKQNQFIDLGDSRRRLQVNNDMTIDGRSVDGTLDVGEFGLCSVLRDEEGASSFKREYEHSEMIPFYYRAWVPRKQDLGAFCLQNIGTYGCKTAIEQLVADEFSARFPDYVFELKEVISKSMIDHYLSKGVVREFSFIQHGVPKDWADGYGGLPLQDNEALLEVKIKAGPGQSLKLPQRLVRYFQGESTLQPRLFELNKFECEKFKVKLIVDGKPRTLSHVEFFNMTSRVDITSEVKRHADGNPMRESIRPIAAELLKNLARDAQMMR